MVRSAVLKMPSSRTPGERRNVLRTAIRQLERSDLYLAAVAAMDLGDGDAQRAVNRLRIELETLRRYLVEMRRLD